MEEKRKRDPSLERRQRGLSPKPRGSCTKKGQGPQIREAREEIGQDLNQNRKGRDKSFSLGVQAEMTTKTPGRRGAGSDRKRTQSRDAGRQG